MGKTKKTELKIIISAVEKGVKQTLGAVNDGFKRSSKSLKMFNQVAKKSTKVTSGLTGQIKNLVAAYLGFRTLSSAVNVLKEADQAAFNLQSSVAAANRQFDNTGSVKEWEASIAGLSDYLKIYSDTALKNAISRTVDMTKRLGLSKKQMEEVIKRSGDLGAGKVELTGAIERVTAALRGEAEASEYLGLTLNENYVKAWYEANKVTKKAWAQLNDMEKAQIRYNVFLEQTAELLGRSGDSAKTFSGVLSLVVKEMENAITKNKDVKKSLSDLSKMLEENAGDIGKVVSQLVRLVGILVETAIKYKALLVSIAGTVAAVAIIKKLVTVVRAVNVAFALLTGISILSGLVSLRDALFEVAASTTALSMAFKAFLALAAAQAVLTIGRLVMVLRDWKKASGEAKVAQQDLASQTEFVNKAAGPQLKEISDRLGIMIRDMDHLFALEKEGVVLFDQTAGKWVAAEKKKQTALNATVNALDAFAKKAKDAYGKALSEVEKYANKVVEFEEKIKYARLTTADKIRELSRKGLSDEQQWADKKLQAEEKLTAAKEALRNKDFKLAEKHVKDSAGLYADLAVEVQRQAADGESAVAKTIEQTTQVAIAGYNAARSVLIQIFSEQKAGAKDIENQSQQAADKIKALMDLISQAQDAKITITAEGLEAISQQIDAIVNEPKEATVIVTADTAQAREEIIQLADGTYTNVTVQVDADTQQAEKALSALERQGEGMNITAQVKAKTAKANAAINAIKNALAGIKDKTVTVTVIKRVKEVAEKAAGGLVRKLAAGGKLFGYGGGDKIRALLEAGEHVTRKEAVRHYGSALFNALNRMRIPKADLAALLGRQAFKTGGPVNPTEAMTITLNAGSASMPMTVLGAAKVTRAMVHQFETELRKLGLSRN